MRLISFVAPTTQQAMAELRKCLGEDAIIVTTQTLDDGRIRITGAIAEDDVDLGDVLAPQAVAPACAWLAELADFHEWRGAGRVRADQAADAAAAADPHALLSALLRSIYRFDSLASKAKRPFLLSGPPGSGKTVTIAKLAAACVLAGRSVDVLTTDLARAGAVEQLSTLLAPLDLKPIAVTRPRDLSSLLASCAGDMILLDSPGTNPFGSADLGALSTLVHEARAELVLVLPAGGSPADSAEIGQCYAALGARQMLVTRMDVARRLGGVLAAADAGLAFSHAGIGPTIGDGLRALTADGLARLLLRRYRYSVSEDARP